MTDSSSSDDDNDDHQTAANREVQSIRNPWRDGELIGLTNDADSLVRKFRERAPVQISPYKIDRDLYYNQRQDTSSITEPSRVLPPAPHRNLRERNAAQLQPYQTDRQAWDSQRQQITRASRW